MYGSSAAQNHTRRFIVVFLSNLKVGSKIILLLAVLLACIGAIAAVGIVELREMDHKSDIMYSYNLQALSSVKEANIQLISMSRAVRNMARVEAGERAGYRKAYELFEARLRSELKIVEKKILSEEAKEVLAETKAALAVLYPENQDIIYNMDRRTSEQTSIRLREARQKEDMTDDLMTALCSAIEEAASQRNQEISESARQAYLTSMATLLTALVVGLTLGLMIMKAIANPLVTLAHKASLVANGDLDQHFTLSRKDELGSLANSLEQMVISLRTRIAEAEQKSREAEEQSEKAQEAMVEANMAKEKAETGQRAILAAAENVEQVVNRLTAATEELSAQVAESSRCTEIQCERVANSATAMDEMSSTALEVAHNAGIAAESSERARGNAGQGQEIVQHSIDSISAVQKDTEELRRNMDELGRQSESIGQIITVISDIADQTNLLALNAAIEAARAGDAGRGFSVVADEVRKLAEKTMNATRDVDNSIREIQSGTRQSLGAVDRTKNNLDATTELVKQSGEALSGIVGEVANTALQVSSIATAAEEQSATSEEITRSLGQISSMAAETTIAMEQSAQAVLDLAQQAQELQQLVNKLRQC